MTNIIKIPTNKPLIDSFTVYIEERKCKILDIELKESYIKYFPESDYTDGEETQSKRISRKIKGITLRINRKEFGINNRLKSQQMSGDRIKYIQITVTTKFLKSNYFQGINKSNIKEIYNELIKFEMVEFSYNTFITSKVNDIDYCINRYVNKPTEFESILSMLKSQTGTKEKYTNFIRTDLNLGLEFKTRRTATPSLPFVKLYYKHWELYSEKSKEFTQLYLSEYRKQIENLTRIEATLGNSKHKKRIFSKSIITEFQTLEEMLNTPKIEMYNFIKHTIDQYITKFSKVKNSELTPMEQLISNLMAQNIALGGDFEMIENEYNYIYGKNEASTKRARNRIKNKIAELIGLLIHHDQKINERNIKNKSINNYLKYLGI